MRPPPRPGTEWPPFDAKRDTTRPYATPARQGPGVTQYVTTPQLAKELGVGVRSLQRWVEAGLIEPDYRTPGGHMRWDVDRVRSELRAQWRRQKD
jgi:hypothetical protein